MKGLKKGLGIYLILFFAMFCGIIWYMNKNSKTDSGYTIVDFQAEVSEDLIGSVEIYQNKEIPTGTVYITYRQTNEEKEFYVSDVNKVQQIIMSKGNGNIRLELHDVSGQSNVWTWLPTVVLIVVLLVVVMIFMANMSGAGGGGGAGGGKMMNFGKSRAHMSNENDQKYTFKDVAGLEEEKEDMAEIVDFLRNPKKYNTLGARIPKGVLLEGPPGTGKTLLAKAVAGEAGVPFFSISGSDFVEMFVGVGASRVRDLFEDAKKNAPCIVFIDEIDAVARKRGSGLGGGHDEREQTLNQMLVEMDGFGTNEGIIVLAATNRVDILDPAILRPGRFDRKVMVGRPDVKGREEILRVHVRNKPLSDDVDLHEIARTTAGFAGADLENLMNEAAICAAKQNRQFIKKEDVDKCFVKIGIGGEKKSRLVPEKERKITAYHESGHAILFHLLSEVGPVHLVSIIPNGRGAGGYTMPLPENDNVFMTKKHMLQDIMVSFGGRIAEELIFDDITTGASNDIERATSMARDMVTKYGMSELLGPIQFGGDNDEVFIGRDWGHARNYGEGVAATIDQEVNRIVTDAYREAKRLLQENMEMLHATAKLLVEKEKVTGDEFRSLFDQKVRNEVLGIANEAEQPTETAENREEN